MKVSTHYKKYRYIIIAMLILGVSLSFTPIAFASNPSLADSDDDGIPDGWENKYRLNPDDPNDANMDYNLDGLTNFEEYERGHDPYNRDTDNDKISNYAEVTGLFGFVTDPLNPDTDKDGLTDLEEIAGMYVSANNQTQMDELFVSELLIEDLKEKYYPYILDPTNPDVDNDGLLDGEEITRGTSPTNIDSDADGLTDYEEVYEYTTNPTNIDTDGDWLPDKEELTGGSYGIITDPTNPDTDGDGISDGEELIAFALVMVYPSEHARTYEEFIADNAYAGEYVTFKARVEKIQQSLDTHYYSIRLKPLESNGDFLFSVESNFKTEFEENNISEDLKKIFEDNGHSLSSNAEISTVDKNEWKIKEGRKEYTIRQSKLNDKLNVYTGDIENKRGIVQVGNSWHYDTEHGMLFIDDVFGYILKEDDVIVVTGVAGKFEGMSREITVKKNHNDAEGSIYLLLDPKEAYSRISVYNLPSPSTYYPFWSHVILVSVSTNYASWPYPPSVNLTSARVSTSNSSTTTNVSKSSSEITSEPEEEKGYIILTANPLHFYLPHNNQSQAVSVLCASIFDESFNQIIDANVSVPISFEIISGSGTLSASTVNTIKGSAKCNLSVIEEGNIVVVASSPGFESDSILVTVESTTTALSTSSAPFILPIAAIVALILCTLFYLYFRLKHKRKGKEAEADEVEWTVYNISKSGDRSTYNISVANKGRQGTIKLDKRLYKRLNRNKELVIGRHHIFTE